MFNFLKKHSSAIFLVLIILFLFYTGKFAILKDRAEAWFGKDKGLKIADMQFNYLQTKQVTKLSQIKGKAVLINFWATWCPPCRFEIPSLMELYSSYNNKGLEIVGLSIDQGGIDTVLPFIREKKINYPVALVDRDILSKFDEIIAVPTSYLLDQNGIVVRKYSGFYLKSTFENDIKKVLRIE
jgi:thiol-disulfide isomerase/thioredoxin